MQRLEHPGMTCGSWVQGGTRCGAPATYVDTWTRTDGKPGRRYYCTRHATVTKSTHLRCVWPACRGEVVAVVDGAPVCDEHEQANEEVDTWR